MSGRPRKACSTCQLQKIRCTGEKPACKRCVRLKHTCSYGGTEKAPRTTEEPRRTSSRPALVPDQVIPSPLGQSQGIYLGIPRTLILELIEIYYGNVSNASLALHKTNFLRRVHAGTANPHIVLSVCAFGANFYKNGDGRASLKTGGFMTEWAQQAGRLAFQEIESFGKELVVTFLNLTLFWHSQGSWKVSSLYKANAFHFLCIHGIGDTKQMQVETFNVEVQRRHFWSWYIMHCHSSEGLGILEAAGNIESLPLPWPEDEFAAGSLASAPACLNSIEGSTSIFAELIKVMTFWSHAVKLIKSPETTLTAERVTAIYAMDEKISHWWRRLPKDMKLGADSVSNIPTSELPLLLLTNLVYHQTLCILHASIVPLFCWTKGHDGWLSTRQMSAQIAYEHACSVSGLISATLSSHSKISAMPTFVAYAAYGGCAILIPFVWCSEPSIRRQAQASVGTNVQMIRRMAEYWKFAALLTVHVNCLYNIHKKYPPVIDNEPRYGDIRQLTGFKVEALYARISILEFLGILQKGPSSFAEPGQETSDLGIMGDDLEATVSDSGHIADESFAPVNVLQQNTASSASSTPQLPYAKSGLPSLMQAQQWNLIPPSGPGIDMFSPSFALGNLDPSAWNETGHPTASDFRYGLLDIDDWDYIPDSID